MLVNPDPIPQKKSVIQVIPQKKSVIYPIPHKKSVIHLIPREGGVNMVADRFHINRLWIAPLDALDVYRNDATIIIVSTSIVFSYRISAKLPYRACRIPPSHPNRLAAADSISDSHSSPSHLGPYRQLGERPMIGCGVDAVYSDHDCHDAYSLH